MTNSLTKTKSGWELNFAGYGLRVVSASPDMVTMLLDNGSKNYVIQIESKFKLLDLNKNEEIFELSESLARSGGLQRLDSLVPARAAVSKEGSLTLAFESGIQLVVEGSKDYEPWNITGPDDLRIISVPDFSVSVWS